MGDEQRRDWNVEPGAGIGEVFLPRRQRHQRTEQEGNKDAGDDQRGEQAKHARGRIGDQGRLRQHAAGDEKTGDDEEHIDREATDLERLEVDRRGAACSGATSAKL
jgi:hypothetical protein